MSDLKAYTYADMLVGVADVVVDFYPKSEVDAAIAKLNAKLEDVQATAYAESVDDGMENRKLKRALWLARAHFCARSCEFFSGIMSHCLIGQVDLYNRCEKRMNKYLKAMYKCRAKAEEYK